MASTGVGSVSSGASGGTMNGVAGTARVRVVTGDILSPSPGSRVGSEAASEDTRRDVIQIDGSELDTRARRGTYLDILV